MATGHRYYDPREFNPERGGHAPERLREWLLSYIEPEAGRDTEGRPDVLVLCGLLLNCTDALGDEHRDALGRWCDDPGCSCHDAKVESYGQLAGAIRTHTDRVAERGSERMQDERGQIDEGAMALLREATVKGTDAQRATAEVDQARYLQAKKLMAKSIEWRRAHLPHGPESEEDIEAMMAEMSELLRDERSKPSEPSQN